MRCLCAFGHYYVEGVGYATVQAISAGPIDRRGRLLLLLFVCKLAATSLSLGSGSSGGIFSPSLFMGAALGGAFCNACLSAGLPLQPMLRVSRWSEWGQWSGPERARR